jgi:hypothetical protein
LARCRRVGLGMRLSLRELGLGLGLELELGLGLELEAKIVIELLSASMCACPPSIPQSMAEDNGTTVRSILRTEQTRPEYSRVGTCSPYIHMYPFQNIPANTPCWNEI